MTWDEGDDREGRPKVRFCAQPLAEDLLRPYRGYSSIVQREFTGYSDYHSIQFAVNRRRSGDGLSFGAAYTYQLVNKTLGSIDPFLPDNRARNCNSIGRRPHTLAINYSYQVANLSARGTTCSRRSSSTTGSSLVSPPA